MFDMNKTLLLASIACLFSLQANADDTLLTHDFGDAKLYIGTDYNSTNAELNDGYDNIVADNYISGSLNVGIKFNQYLGIEGFFQKSNEESSLDSYLKTSFYAYGTDLLFYTPLNKKTNFLVSTGIAKYKVEAKLKYAGLSINDSESGIGTRVGLGLEYNIDKNWSIRAIGRYVMLNLDSVENIKELSLGIRYYF